MRYLVALGRLLYSLIFVVAGFGHFTHQEIAYAAAQGIPFAGVLVPASGIMAIVGGLSILLGFHGKLGAWLLVLFLVPVTFTMHNFWAVKDPMMQQIQMAMFLKNISMLGSALFFTQIGTGPLSLDSRRAPAH
ncbi:MAG TPA: DoxX family protein [Candidatus Acidoferrum sp.]|jgi:putative oxidoreductase|nr:DoxX family protein [Candidatus Acidoferrum sp.]